MEFIDCDGSMVERRWASGRPIVVAHRAGNIDPRCPLPPEWSGHIAGVVEVDVHWFKGRIEVRHSKALWPTSWLFEGRRLESRAAPRPTFASVIEALPAGAELWIDLKGPDPRLSRSVESMSSEGRPSFVSARCWWQLAPFRRRAGTRTFMSVGSRWQRSLASRVLERGWSDGIVIHDRLADPRFLASTTPSAPVVVWAVEDRERARSLISQGVAGLILDSATLISQVRADIDSNGQYADPP